MVDAEAVERIYNPTATELGEAIEEILEEESTIEREEVYFRILDNYPDWHINERRVAKFLKRIKSFHYDNDSHQADLSSTRSLGRFLTRARQLKKKKKKQSLDQDSSVRSRSPLRSSRSAASHLGGRGTSSRRSASHHIAEDDDDDDDQSETSTVRSFFRKRFPRKTNKNDSSSSKRRGKRDKSNASVANADMSKTPAAAGKVGGVAERERKTFEI